jgi:Cytochrome c554 and c-prime
MRFVRVLLIGVCCAVLAAVMTAVVYAQDPQPDPDSDECIGCHEGLRDHWDDSSHAQAFDDPAFQSSWKEQGEPQECLACHTSGFDPATGEYFSEGVDCLACHYPIVNDHPNQYMPTDVSSRLCGNCHTETFSEWEDSSHAQEDMACGQCHNAHTAELRVGDSQALCETCHQDQSHYFAFTGHASEGLTCTDCHLTVKDSPLGEGHGSRQHSFEVDLNTCNRCHDTDMHSAVEEQAALKNEKQVACYRTDTVRLPATPEQPLYSEPQETTNPMIYFLPAGIGLVLGMIVAPWTGDFIRGRKGEK